MSEAIATVAALVWLFGGIYMIYAIRHFIKRCDKVIFEMEEDVRRGREEMSEAAKRERRRMGWPM